MAANDTMRRETGAMKDEARAMWSDATDVARDAASRQQDAAAEGIGNFAGALREAARNTEGSAGTSRVAETIADGLDRMSRSLKGRDLGSLVHDVEDFARTQPLVFFGAAVVGGFLAMRFLKSSAPAQAADDGAMQRDVPTREGALRPSHATEFETSTAMAGTRSTDDLPHDTARGRDAAPSVWPESNPARDELRATHPRSDTDAGR